jgi:uncharacterized alkaline shock family protein YloU
MNVGRTVAETPVAEKIAALTALATPGVIRLEPSISALAASLGRRALSWYGGRDGAMPPTAGVRADITGNRVTVEVALTVELGRSVPAVTADAQRRIADALRELGSFTVGSVTIFVADVDYP